MTIIITITRVVQTHESLLAPCQKDISFHLSFLGAWGLLFPHFWGPISNWQIVLPHLTSRFLASLAQQQMKVCNFHKPPQNKKKNTQNKQKNTFPRQSLNIEHFKLLVDSVKLENTTCSTAAQPWLKQRSPPRMLSGFFYAWGRSSPSYKVFLTHLWAPTKILMTRSIFSSLYSCHHRNSYHSFGLPNI